MTQITYLSLSIPYYGKEKEKIEGNITLRFQSGATMNVPIDDDLGKSLYQTLIAHGESHMKTAMGILTDEMKPMIEYQPTTTEEIARVIGVDTDEFNDEQVHDQPDEPFVPAGRTPRDDDNEIPF